VTVGGQVRTAFLATTLLGVLAVVVAALVTGSSGAAGAAVGAGMVLVFFGTGAVVVNAVASVSPTASLLIALLTYTLQVVLVGLVFAALNGSGLLDSTVDRTWAGAAVIAATLVWLVAQIVSATRSRQPLYDLPEHPSDGQEASAR
jgi:ATP synthase protein I